MKKLLTVLFFAASLFCLSLTAAEADPGCAPGCPCPSTPDSTGMKNHGGVLGAIENHGNAMRLRDKAMGRQIIKQNDNGLGMTCFDRSLALTSRIGASFSDVVPTGPFPGPNTAVFLSPIYSMNYGADKWLVQGLNSVVIPQLQGHVDEFTDSLSDELGATSANFFGPLMGAFTGFFGPVMTALSTFNTVVTTFTTLISAYQAAMVLLGTIVGVPAFGVIIPTLINAIRAAYNAIRNFINNALRIAQNAVKTLINTLVAWLMGPATSMAAGSTPAGDGDCDRIRQLWGQGPGGFPPNFQNQPEKRALLQTGRQAGTGYFSFAELLSMAPPGTGLDLRAELGNASNSSIITNALNDMGAGGVLSGPGNMPSWPAAQPAFPVNTPLGAIIGAM